MSLGVFAGDPAAAPVLAAMEKGKWRPARDLAKGLCKSERARYLPLLVAANAGLARDLIARGLLSDARSVLDHLKTFAPADLVAGLEKEFSSPRGPSISGGADPESALCAGAAIIRLWDEILRIATDAESGKEPTREDIVAIDDAVTAFSDPPAVPGNDLALKIASELAAVHAACEATAEGRWDDATAALRLVPARSVFRHWRIFLRGVRASIRGAHAEARECFARLPEGGACALAAAAIRGDPAGRSVRPAARAAWDLASSGQPSEWAADIAAADTAWRTGHWTGAKDSLVRAMGSGFPCVGNSLAAALSSALFFVGREEDATSKKRLRQHLEFFEQLLDREKIPRSWMLLMRRSILLEEAYDMPPHAIFHMVADLLQIESHLLGRNPIRDSQGWQWAGEKLAENSAPANHRYWENPKPRDRERAVRAFESATTCDPDNEAAWLGLLGVLDDGGKKSDRNRLLDGMVRKFPHNKRVLIRAGELAVGRGAFTKGIGYLESARALDPLDPALRNQILDALMQHVRDAHLKYKESESIWARIEPMLDSSPSCESLVSAKWTARLRRALLDSRNAPQARAEAERLAPSRMEFLALESVLCDIWKLPLRDDWQTEWAAVSPTWLSVAGVFRILRFALESPVFKKFTPRRAAALCLKALDLAAAANLFVSDPRTALRTFVNLIRMEGSQDFPLHDIASLCLDKMSQLVGKLPKNAVKGSLHLRVLALAFKASSRRSTGKEKSIKAFEALLAEAEKSGDTDLVATIAKLLGEFRENGYDPAIEDPDFDDSDFDDPDERMDFSDIGVDTSGIQLFEKFMQAVAAGDLDMMQKISQKMKDLGIPVPGMARPKKSRAKVPPAPKKSDSRSDSQEEFSFPP
jgi:tetratricopeptide (TPR) repeat protein